jgi:hypothetical protein
VRQKPRARRTATVAVLTALASAWFALGAIGCGSEEDSGGANAGDTTTIQRTSTARQEARRERAKRRRQRAKIREERIAQRAERRAERRRQARRIARAEARRERRQQLQEAAAAAAAEQSCHPSYDPCLDPNSSDYDCDGGSGDGPDYTGPVTVKGDDPYGLDSDGDGYGCES